MDRPNTPNWYAYVVSFNKSIKPPSEKLLEFIEEEPLGINILHSCNGLLVCSNIHVNDYTPSRFYVCNPTTRRYLKLPQLDEKLGILKTMCEMVLALDPSKSPHYKVVCVLGLGLDNQYEFEVYSSLTGSWSKCGETFTAQVNFHNGVYWNGAIHWISFAETGKSIYLNPDDQVTRVMPKPPILNSPYPTRNCYFGESCGYLHYIDVYRYQFKFNVYEMRSDYSEWYFMYIVDLSNVVSSFVHPFMTVCTLVRGEKEDDSFLVFEMMGKMVRYNFFDKTRETIHDPEAVENRLVDPVAKLRTATLQYIESLCSI
ncbi:hypothetical protein DH2020_022471 [Rehmannia glutinosa]|uniref:F-box associated beta-propeller type 1 domain-containing protein n=1 Tax=Rehmannia glutinosa TaxID=99300 RepID=A0ABR0WGD2_REHGL